MTGIAFEPWPHARRFLLLRVLLLGAAHLALRRRNAGPEGILDARPAGPVAADQRHVATTTSRR